MTEQAGACWDMNECDLDRRRWELVSSCFSYFIALFVKRTLSVAHMYTYISVMGSFCKTR